MGVIGCGGLTGAGVAAARVFSGRFSTARRSVRNISNRGCGCRSLAVGLGRAQGGTVTGGGDRVWRLNQCRGGGRSRFFRSQASHHRPSRGTRSLQHFQGSWCHSRGWWGTRADPKIPKDHRGGRSAPKSDKVHFFASIEGRWQEFCQPPPSDLQVFRPWSWSGETIRSAPAERAAS